MTPIETQVMAAVRVIHFARTVLSIRALALYALALSSLALWKLVWVHRVFENFLSAERSGGSATETYLLTALSHAHAGVQVALACALVAAAFFVTDVIRARAVRPVFAA